ncbi:DNA-binding response OmpR family regulator [Barrientosiimonas humi]|uniref:DNA-binding response OmpR family regulator n=2 Tax=Barrientosiimonas TaxID=1535207 RepID=A0A542XF26_9MICO|nr:MULTISPECIES: response regulator transcription factor [Barrientosiimonas]TQL34433.1 DNA-binding response OmpR family regulator [Barrientosiimonas humi]BDZ59498.1 transcriptional regulatory protein GlnR [Barrientosiimonas endolithica]CAG7574422.1 Transcriptional regulatory protein YycF [Barrientosiimonas humi]
MARLLLLTDSPGASVDVLPALGLLAHRVRILPPEAQALVDPPDCEVVLLDCTRDLAGAKGLSRMLRSTGLSVPLIAIFAEGGLVALNGEWQVDDVVLTTAGPAEVQARITLAAHRGGQTEDDDEPSKITAGGLVIDEGAYAAKLHGSALDLTYKEFELLKYLAQHPGRVFTRAQLLQEVWGYDYFGGTRTVDVHVRRLRAKLGPEHESLIGTVRNVGYRFVGTPQRPAEDADAAEARDPAAQD